MNKKLARKLILSIGTATMTAACLTTSTYAWFARNGDAIVEEMNLNLETGSGLLVSLDGTNFSQDITFEMIKAKIEENTGKPYNEIKYKPVTLKHDTQGKIIYNNNYPVFEKDKLNRVNDELYSHNFVDAEVGDYLQFDLWFRLESNEQRSGNWDLFFSKTRSDNLDQDGNILDEKLKTGIVGNTTTTKLNNRMTTLDHQYQANDYVTFNPADAMRMGVRSNNYFRIYEPEVGLGSAAIPGADPDGVHSFTKNAMISYYNNLYPKAPFNESDFASKYNESYEGFQTVSNTATESCYTIDRLHKFNYANDIENHYEDVKLTFVMWLEGWDADYFDGIDSADDYDPSQFKVNLNFIVKRSND